LLTQNPQPVVDGNDDHELLPSPKPPGSVYLLTQNLQSVVDGNDDHFTKDIELWPSPKSPGSVYLLTQNPQPVVDGDNDHPGEGGQAGPIVHIAAAPAVGLSVYEEDDWKSRLFFTWAKQKR
jgi:hypothetical protein